MNQVVPKYDPEAINALPLAEFNGRIIVILDERSAEMAVDYLISASIFGIASESIPAFKRGVLHEVALLQVSTHDTCFLFRLNRIGLCPAVLRLLENTKVPMVGLSLANDISMLRRRVEFNPGLFIDVQTLVGEIGIEDQSLQKIYANLFGQKISKRQRLSNWEADVLTEPQQKYAALDAYACIKIYEEVQARLRRN